MKSLVEKYGTRKNEQGFTLMELLVVILIIGILAAIAIPSYMNHRNEASTASLKSDLKNVAISMETGAIKNFGKYSLTLPTDIPLSKGNTLKLKEQSGSTNIAAGSEITSGEKRPGRNAGRYHKEINTNVQTLSPTGTYVNGLWRDVYDTISTDVYGGIYWDYIPSEPLQKGQQMTSQVDIKGSQDWCLNKRFEQLTSAGNPSTAGEAVCGVANEWTTVTMSMPTTYDDVTRVTATYYMSHKPGDVMEYKNPFIVFGDSVSEHASMSNDSLFCVEGTTDSKKNEYWHYSKVNGGVREGRC